MFNVPNRRFVRARDTTEPSTRSPAGCDKAGPGWPRPPSRRPFPSVLELPIDAPHWKIRAAAARGLSRESPRRAPSVDATRPVAR